MPTTVDRHRLLTLLGNGVQLVEVLPPAEYDDEHLPGAISLPLEEIDQRAAEVLDRGRPVVVYCWDAVSDMSPRAAWRLETLGFAAVFRYAGGKADWMAAGHATEGPGAARPRVGQRARRNVPRSRLDERRGEAATRAHAARWRMSIVVNEHDIVLGVLEGTMLDGDPDTTVACAMHPGPSTFRAHMPVTELADFLDKRGLHRGIITTPDGELIGVVFRDDL